MALVEPLYTGDIPIKSESGSNKITADDIATAVKDTFINKTAIAPSTYPEIYGSLNQYGSGIPTTVEYFKKRAAYINNQTIDTSFSGERSAVHFSFDLIHNFEIRLKDQVDINIDPESTEITINGTATVYPGFKPNVGDMFYMKVPDNNIGVFIVNNTLPLAITRGAHYQIDFHLDSLLDQPTEERMTSSVSEELYFDKQYYFSDEAALLTSTSYNQLDSLVRIKKAIISSLMNKFYLVSEKTIIYPNSIYDPFLIEYLMNKISLKDNRRDLTQIPNPFVSRFENCIWQTFLNRDVTTLSFIGYTLHFYQQYLFDVNTSNIDQMRVVSLIESGETYNPLRYRQAKFELTDVNFRIVNYVFSNRLYYALLESFNSTIPVDNITEHLSEISTDSRLYENLNASFYSITDGNYHSIEYFDVLDKLTGSNNDMHLPEIEFMVFDFIINNNINIEYLIEKVLSKFPFVKMTDLDKLYTYSLLLHLIDNAILRIR